MQKITYHRQLENARANYLDRDDFKGLGYLSSLELGQFLTENWAWDWFTTHTFRKEDISFRAATSCWYSWLNSIRLMAKGAGLPTPYYFRVSEMQNARSVPTIHFHALLGGVEPLRRLLAKDLWEVFGFARVLPYDPDLGAGFYLGKYLTKNTGAFEFSHNLLKRAVTYDHAQ